MSKLELFDMINYTRSKDVINGIAEFVDLWSHRGVIVSVDPLVVVSGGGKLELNPIYIYHIEKEDDYPNNGHLMLKYGYWNGKTLCMVLWSVLDVDYRIYCLSTKRSILVRKEAITSCIDRRRAHEVPLTMHI